MRVAVDATPLVGPRTGVGRFVEALLPALDRRDDMDVRAVRHEPPGSRGHPGGHEAGAVPAGLGAAVVGPGRRRRSRQLLPSAEVVHGTNQIAPPTARTVVTVNDCSFVTTRELCSPTVVSFGPVVRRIAASGGWIHTPSEHVAVQARALFETDRVVAVSHGPPLLAPAGNPVSNARVGPRDRHARAAEELPRLVHAFAAVAAHDPK